VRLPPAAELITVIEAKITSAIEYTARRFSPAAPFIHMQRLRCRGSLFEIDRDFITSIVCRRNPQRMPHLSALLIPGCFPPPWDRKNEEVAAADVARG
jgi:hypothetical protein